MAWRGKEETQVAGPKEEAMPNMTSRFLTFSHRAELHEITNILPFLICRNSGFVRHTLISGWMVGHSLTKGTLIGFALLWLAGCERWLQTGCYTCWLWRAFETLRACREGCPDVSGAWGGAWVGDVMLLKQMLCEPLARFKTILWGTCHCILFATWEYCDPERLVSLSKVTQLPNRGVEP